MAKAEKMYEAYFINDMGKVHKEYDWALLRFSETCQALGKIEKTRTSVIELNYLVESRKPIVVEFNGMSNDNEVDIKLLKHLSILLWECGLTVDAKNVAIKILNSDLVKSHLDKIKIKLNLMYYNADIAEQNNDNGYIVQSSLFNEIFHLEGELLEAINDLDDGDLTSNAYDNLAHHFYVTCEYFFEKNELDKAVKANNLAKNNINKCISMCKNDSSCFFDSAWLDNEKDIKAQERRLSL